MINRAKFFALLFFTSNILGIGFDASTLVLTPDGYIPISQLKPRDTIISYDLDDQTPIVNTIIGIRCTKTDTLIQIHTKNDIIEVHPDHKFYCPTHEGGWITAKDLKQYYESSKLQGLGSDGTALMDIDIDAITDISKSTTTYCLTTLVHHNFYVSEDKILVHNFVPIVASITVSWGAGVAVETSIAIAGIVFGAWTIKNAIEKGSRNKGRREPDYREPSRGGGNQKPPNDPKDPGKGPGVGGIIGAGIGAEAARKAEEQAKKNQTAVSNAVQSIVKNWNQFFDTDFGKTIKSICTRTNYIWKKKGGKGTVIYRTSKDWGNIFKEGDYFYVDFMHGEHIEVFKKSGMSRHVLNLDGTINIVKSKLAENRDIKIFI